MRSLVVVLCVLAVICCAHAESESGNRAPAATQSGVRAVPRTSGSAKPRHHHGHASKAAGLSHSASRVSRSSTGPVSLGGQPVNIGSSVVLNPILSQSSLESPLNTCPAGLTCCQVGRELQGCKHKNGICCGNTGFCCPPGFQCKSAAGVLSIKAAAPICQRIPVAKSESVVGESSRVASSSLSALSTSAASASAQQSSVASQVPAPIQSAVTSQSVAPSTSNSGTGNNNNNNNGNSQRQVVNGNTIELSNGNGVTTITATKGRKGKKGRKNRRRHRKNKN